MLLPMAPTPSTASFSKATFYLLSRLFKALLTGFELTPPACRMFRSLPAAARARTHRVPRPEGKLPSPITPSCSQFSMCPHLREPAPPLGRGSETASSLSRRFHTSRCVPVRGSCRGGLPAPRPAAGPRAGLRRQGLSRASPRRTGASPHALRAEAHTRRSPRRGALDVSNLGKPRRPTPKHYSSDRAACHPCRRRGGGMRLWTAWLRGTMPMHG